MTPTNCVVIATLFGGLMDNNLKFWTPLGYANESTRTMFGLSNVCRFIVFGVNIRTFKTLHVK